MRLKFSFHPLLGSTYQQYTIIQSIKIIKMNMIPHSPIRRYSKLNRL